jgi:glycosyltransferase involved in cell wall biosynthesis
MEKCIAFMPNTKIKIALPLIGRGAWTGGYVYLKNTLRLINSRLANEIEPSVFLSPNEFEKYGEELSSLTNGRLIVDPSIQHSGRGSSLARAILTGKDASLERLFKAAKIDAAFEIANFYGARFAIPTIAWMPDYQHRHMPHMFSRSNWWRRDIGFRMQIASGRTLMLSSQTACDDMERYYPNSKGRGHVVRFAIDLDIAAHTSSADEMRATYSLPKRFFFLPNQFWRHKNHTIIISALAKLKNEGRLKDLPPIILSGLNKDGRNPLHFDNLMRQVHEAGMESHFKYLGLIPYNHVLNLVGCCNWLINPSLFEGWSTPIEEAKALGAPLILSDISLHREQAPEALFFDPNSIDNAAEALLNCAAREIVAREPLNSLIAAQNARLDQHAESLLKTVFSAVGRGKRD